MPHRKSLGEFTHARPILVHNRTPSASLNAPYLPSRTDSNEDNAGRPGDSGLRADGSARSRSAYPQSPYADGGASRTDHSRVGISSGHRVESEYPNVEPSSTRTLRNNSEASFKHMADTSVASQRRPSAVNGRSDGSRTSGRRKSTDSINDGGEFPVAQHKEAAAPLTVKITVLGDTETGKTSLVVSVGLCNIEYPAMRMEKALGIGMSAL